MSSISCSLNPNDPGLILITEDDDFMMPKLISPKTDVRYHLCGGLEPKECLFLFYQAINYKFFCENFIDLFEQSKPYSRAYYKILIMERNPWFPSECDKLLKTNERKFFQEFFIALKQDLKNYNGQYSKELVDKSLYELNKLFEFLF